MSKYSPLWQWLAQNAAEGTKLTFAEIERIAGVPLDHSFLSFKKELPAFGLKVGKISMKEQTVTFNKL